jgi:Protein of unknown function (DUF4058)
MSSPFPGMDPYLEHPAHWCDFHATFIACWRDALRATLPGHYSARIGERVYLVETSPETRKLIGPDVAVERQPGPPSRHQPTPTATTAVQPVTVPLLIYEEVRETWIEILHRPDRNLVAVLELLSPANKTEPGRGEYLAKRNAILRGKAHLVELDLLLGGQRLPMREKLPSGDYHAFVSRAEKRPDCDVYSWTIAQTLPPLPVPLMPPDPDVSIDLEAVFAVTYERGDYAHEVDYTLPPPVPVSDETLRWISDRLQPPQ